jgi:hypothetical protein
LAREGTTQLLTHDWLLLAAAMVSYTVFCIERIFNRPSKRGKEDSFRHLTFIFGVNHLVDTAENHMERVLWVFGTVDEIVF